MGSVNQERDFYKAQNVKLQQELEKATEEVNTFIRAFQIARPKAISGLPETTEVRTVIGKGGIVECVESVG
ncbi:hypothetical protein QB910_000061 [Dabrowskivirus KKP3916]|uniref:Uncharacterized protein n=1 Tax=Alicyclobacillus phage KKP_3916 TaxID=3040651 RepID=A0AAT9V7J9_9CAUD|nr:hypothetical protein QB910_000061 [Alicyclobacillus phage KKP 3916]